MIGRAAQGRPWIFREIAHFLATGEHLPPPETLQAKAWLVEHLHDHYGLYGELAGVRSARKHIGWAVRALPGGEDFRARMNRIDDCAAQLRAVHDWFDALADTHPRLPATSRAANDDFLARAGMSKKHIEECIRESLEGYFKDLRGVEPTAMYDMILRVVEKPLLDVVMKHAEGNQSRAAEWLGINRNTLRRKLLDHKLIK